MLKILTNQCHGGEKGVFVCVWGRGGEGGGGGCVISSKSKMGVCRCLEFG